jgi:hypothetical protein
MTSTTSTELIDCNGLPAGSLLEVETKNRHYQIECLGGSAIRICGHPDYCPTPSPGRVLDGGIIQRGSDLQFLLDDCRPVTTTRVVRLRVKQPERPSSIH